MAWNGSGTFVRSEDFTTDRDAGNPDNIISADKMDDEFDNYKTGLENCVTRNGENTPSADLPMGTQKHTGVGAATSRTDYGRTTEIQDGAIIGLTSVAGTDTITATAALSMSAYAVNQVFHFVAADTNTGATTINLNSIGAKAIQKNGAALVAGDITSGDGVTVLYDGTQFQMTSPARTPVLTAGGIPTAALADNAVDETKLKDALIGDFTEVTVATGDSILLGDADDSGNTKRDTVQGIIDLVPADLIGKTDATIATGDKIIFGDVDDSDNPKTDTVQGIIDLVGSSVTLGTAQASTSGTSIDFTSIPAGTKRITINFVGCSLSGADDFLVQIGDSGGVEATGYLGSGSVLAGASQATENYTTGWGLRVTAATTVIHGAMTLTLVDASTFTWASTSMVGDSDITANYFGGGSKSLSAELDRVRITTLGGSDTFDAGKINIMYE